LLSPLTMPYHPKIIEKIKSQPMSLGTRLGRWAVYLDVPAAKIAMAIGATRQSVYNWMKGGEVFVAYRPAVERVINIMQSCQTGEEAWSKICKEFDLRA
jgi:hypothetical protein